MLQSRKEAEYNARRELHEKEGIRLVKRNIKPRSAAAGADVKLEKCRIRNEVGCQ